MAEASRHDDLDEYERGVIADVDARAQRFGWSKAERDRTLLKELLGERPLLKLYEPGVRRKAPVVRERPPEPTLDELASYVLSRTQPSGNDKGCVPWTGGASKDGYGRFKMRRKLYSPHRVVLERKGRLKPAHGWKRGEQGFVRLPKKAVET